MATQTVSSTIAAGPPVKAPIGDPLNGEYQINCYHCEKSITTTRSKVACPKCGLLLHVDIHYGS